MGVAVVLMDTQGAFDRKTSLRATITVFALSLLTSSTFIYNLDENIQEDDLQHLQFFTNYGKLALDDSGDTPFQKLVFTVVSHTGEEVAVVLMDNQGAFDRKTSL